MTPGRQKELRAYLSGLASNFDEKMLSENIDALDMRMSCLQQVLGQNMTLTEMLGWVEKLHGPGQRASMEQFIAAAAAMTVATSILSK